MRDLMLLVNVMKLSVKQANGTMN
uniref:Uncharacterized protein n=1 Tax=Musa acuminata subsp. malaccensis TaxID=214687 RepID=A0A804KVF3_MUSAM